MRVAVIDDESIFRMQLKMMVEKLSASKEIPLEVEEFSSGPDFIAVLSERRFDIVFMDIFMPDMDGIEAAKKLREMTEKTFLIFMTASEGHYPDAFSLHAFDYVTKPFTIERIDQVLTEMLLGYILNCPTNIGLPHKLLHQLVNKVVGKTSRAHNITPFIIVRTCLDFTYIYIL